MKSAKNKRIFILSVAILGILIAAYSNHFTNGFYFDDAHVINSNGAIRDISNIPSFFTDPTTFSSQPANQAYRPMVTLLDAFDYWMAGGELNPVYFHAHIFFWYIVQCVLMFFLFRSIIQISIKHRWSDYIALIAVGWYALHTANAETINYVSARSDSFSTLCVVAGLLLYQVKRTRKLYLYLIPLLIGVMTKQSAVMAYPLLFLYIYFFETEEESPLQGMLDALKYTTPRVYLC